MKPHLLTESASSANPAAADKVSRKQLRERAVELAALDGREPQDAGKSDWELAKHELIGEPELEPKAPSDNAGQVDSNPTGEAESQTPGWFA
ncbi:hypothetical protein [Prosthecobacter sp.]|jgi:hypothetical protein|uniref:hypothetical protein n=1 Tax=Prosthecobacter sp. TaxID=1965333 RepID=UPI0037CB2812